MGFPGLLELKKGGQNVHLNGVAKWALGMTKDLKKWEPHVVINEDYVIVGALCHDLGKANELDPENIKRWEEDPTKAGYHLMRHPIYGAAIATAAGLPEPVCHIVACHSAEGKEVIKSVECNLVVAEDIAYWYMTSAVGMIKENTIPIKRKFVPRDLEEAVSRA